ncbi:phage portal protein [Novacetimonas maltaceti]|uniref:Phage portal protein n=1 Tax=Novacetimonas maltaceti TaxID=1203393 RepID=A0A2S3VZW8_9PROT|nr:phage portal protein [Novacetimonas maltaceti]POF62159.1 Phage portal protein [Novacetimonas maltaceti]PYD59194.1 phage portal protein [Novacetimonas maltaceti]BCZ75969.1 phage portal protein [Komagataeibacter phage phiKM1]
MALLPSLFSPRRAVERREPRLSLPATRTKADSFASGSYPSWLSAGLGALPSATGLPVTPFTAMQAAAVFSCVNRISEDLAKIPLQVQEILPNGRGALVTTTHPLAQLLASPNRWMTAYQFWFYVTVCLCMRGNSYVAIVRGQNGQPRSLIPIMPDRVSVLMSPRGWIFYHISHPLVGEGIRLHQDDMIHLRGFTLDGYMGISPIMACPEAIGLAIAAQRHGATLFRNGTQIQGVLKTSKSLSKETAARIASSWRNAYGGVDNTGKTAVLEEGMEYERIGMTADEAQFLEVREKEDIDICGMFGVPPHKIGRGDKVTISNFENASQEYIDNALIPKARQAEEQIHSRLVFSEEKARLRVRFNFDELLRGDMQSRVTAGVAAVNSGLISANEWRAREGMNPYPRGDEYRVPLNTGAASTAPAVDDPARITAPDPAAQT